MGMVKWAVAVMMLLGTGFAAAPAQASSVTGVTAASLSSTATGIQHVKYSVGFTATTGSAGAGTIKIDAPAGTVLPAGATINNGTTGATFSVGGTRTNANATNTLNLTAGQFPHAGDSLTVTFSDVTNPTSTSGNTLGVSTSTDTTPVATPAYTLTAPVAVTGVTGPTLSSSAGGIQHVKYTLGFTASATTGGLVSPGTITVDTPVGTVLPSGATINDATTGQTFTVGGTRTNSNRTIALNISGGEVVNAGDAVTITFNDVTNPATGSGYQISISTSSDTTAVLTGTYALTAPASITSVTAVTLSSSATGIQHVNTRSGSRRAPPPAGLSRRARSPSTRRSGRCCPPERRSRTSRPRTPSPSAAYGRTRTARSRSTSAAASSSTPATRS